MYINLEIKLDIKSDDFFATAEYSLIELAVNISQSKKSILQLAVNMSQSKKSIL